MLDVVVVLCRDVPVVLVLLAGANAEPTTYPVVPAPTPTRSTSRSNERNEIPRDVAGCISLEDTFHLSPPNYPGIHVPPLTLDDSPRNPLKSAGQSATSRETRIGPPGVAQPTETST